MEVINLPKKYIRGNGICFCSKCESYLYNEGEVVGSDFTCKDCNLNFVIPKELRVMKTVYEYNNHMDENKKDNNDVGGSNMAEIEFDCIKCDSNKAFYRAVQTRSADEGQTVFYECVKCGEKTKTND